MTNESRRGPLVLTPTGITHELKTWREHFSAVFNRTKTAEVRQREAGTFRVGDQLRFRETDPASGAYTGRECWRAVSHVLEGPPFLPAGTVVLSLRFPFNELEHVTAEELDPLAAQRILARLAARCRYAHATASTKGPTLRAFCACLYRNTDSTSVRCCERLRSLQAGGDETQWLADARALASALPELPAGYRDDGEGP